MFETDGRLTENTQDERVLRVTMGLQFGADYEWRVELDYEQGMPLVPHPTAGGALEWGGKPTIIFE